MSPGVTILLIGSSIKYVCVCVCVFLGRWWISFHQRYLLRTAGWRVGCALVCFHLPSILSVKPASVYLPKVTLLPTSSLGLTSRCAESGCNPTLPGLPHCPTLKPEPTDHRSALSNPLPCQEGAPCKCQVTLVFRGQKASLSGRARESGGPNLGFLSSRGPEIQASPVPPEYRCPGLFGRFWARVFCFVLFCFRARVFKKKVPRDRVISVQLSSSRE